MPIINSLLDTDLYKFTTGYAYSKLFPYAEGVFRFIDRSERIYPSGFDTMLRQEVAHLSSVALTDDEARFVASTMPYIPPTYIDFLRGFRFDPKELQIRQDDEGKLHRATLPSHFVGNAPLGDSQRALLPHYERAT